MRARSRTSSRPPSASVSPASTSPIPASRPSFPFSTSLSPDAAALGAVNTVVLKDGRRIGHNTDWWGFAESFRRELPDVRRDRVVQFGAGGAGAAVAHALLTLGTGEVIIDRHGSRPVPRTSPPPCESGSAIGAPPASFVRCRMRWTAADGIVNTTPLGMAKYPGMAAARRAAAPRALGRRHRLLPAGDRTAAPGPRPRMPHHVRRRHGGLPGRGRFSALYRPRPGCVSDAPPFRGNVRLGSATLSLS